MTYDIMTHTLGVMEMIILYNLLTTIMSFMIITTLQMEISEIIHCDT